MKLYLSFLKTYIFKEPFNYIYLAVLSLLVIVNLLFFSVKWFRSWYKKSLSFIILVLFILTFGEFLTVGAVFKSFEYCFFAFFSAVCLQSFIYYFLAPLKKPKPKGLKIKKESEIKSDYGLSVKRAIERVITAEETPQVFSGYVDVKYIKSLIDDLKTNDLSEQDSREIEDLEVYLLNFVNRQPNNLERKELSLRLNGLIKTLSKYA